MISGVAFASGFWLSAIGRFLVVADPLGPADAILPLAGELERVRHAASLHNDGYAPWLILTNMTLRSGHPTNYVRQARDVALRLGVPAYGVVLVPGTAATTMQEAANARALTESRGWSSLIVVTSPSHTRRASIIFRNAFRGTGTHVSVQPLRDHWYRADTWWKSEHGRRETGLEYLKLVAYFVGVR